MTGPSAVNSHIVDESRLRVLERILREAQRIGALSNAPVAEIIKHAKWFAEATADIAVQLADQVPGLDSPLLRLVKERNEARELVKQMYAVVNVDSVGEMYHTAMLEAHRAIITWKGGAK